MTHDVVAILGIPVDNRTMDEAMEAIFSMVDAFGEDRRPRQVATVNVDFYVNTLAWSLDAVRHPELLDVLRRADLVTADGMPIVWVSRLLGAPLRERVAGADMVVRLAAEGEKRGTSLYFLGGKGDVAQLAAERLKQLYPRLRIAGVDAPFVYTEGEELLSFAEDDTPIIEKINQSKPDILLVAFGNPKQELWFARNRYRLNVPVTIGIGGTFEFIAGRVKRAPEVIQKAGLEWLYRVCQEPRRLWKRYFVGICKFGYMILPPLSLAMRDRRKRAEPQSDGGLSVQKIDSTPETTEGGFRLVRLPDRLDAGAAGVLSRDLTQICAPGTTVVLDFKDVLFADSSGLGAIIQVWRAAERNGAYLYLVGMTSRAHSLLTCNRLWDMVEGKVFPSARTLRAEIEKQGHAPSFYFVTEEQGDHLLVSLFGRLDAASYSRIDIAAVKSQWKGRTVIMDMGALTFIDSAGLRFFLQIERSLCAEEGQCRLAGMTRAVRQVFEITKLDHHFDIRPDVAAAKKELSSQEQEG